VTREQIDALEDKLIANVDALESEFCCKDVERARYDVERAEIAAFCSWARTKVRAPGVF
jgi:hypothetical protein